MKCIYNNLDYIITLNETFCMKIFLSKVIKFGQMIPGLYCKDFSYDNNKFLALYINCISSFSINNVMSIITYIKIIAITHYLLGFCRNALFNVPEDIEYYNDEYHENHYRGAK